MRLKLLILRQIDKLWLDKLHKEEVEELVKKSSEKEPGRNTRWAVYTGAPGGIRTHNHLLRRQVLCPLSYRGREKSLHTGTNAFIHSRP